MQELIAVPVDLSRSWSLLAQLWSRPGCETMSWRLWVMAVHTLRRGAHQAWQIE